MIQDSVRPRNSLKHLPQVFLMDGLAYHDGIFQLLIASHQ